MTDDNLIPFNEAKKRKRRSRAKPNGDAIAAVIDRLSKLSALEYDQVRDAEAEALGVQKKTLDHAVKIARGDANESLQGHALDLPESEPWGEPVDGAVLLDTLVARIRSHAIVSYAQAVSIALWVAATHAVDAFDYAPRLGIRSSEKGSGKTTLLDLLEGLAHRPLLSGGLSAAVIARVVESAKPTLLIDEIDTLLPENEALRGILNIGHKRGGQVIKCVGDDLTPRGFSVYGFVALACKGELPGTVEDRCVPIVMVRAAPEEKPARIGIEDRRAMAVIARKCRRFALDNLDRLRGADPELPGWLTNRAADNWRGLVAIAEIAGPAWRARAVDAAAALLGNEDTMSVRARLLSDIRDIFALENVDRMASEDLVQALIAIEGRPWAEWRGGKAMSKHALAAQLRPFRINPNTIRLPGGATPKGYMRDAFADAWGRYIPPL